MQLSRGHDMSFVCHEMIMLHAAFCWQLASGEETPGVSAGDCRRKSARGDEAETENKLYTWTSARWLLAVSHPSPTVDVVHHAHLTRRTPPLAQSAAECEEDERVLLYHCCRPHPRQGCFHSFLFVARSVPRSPCISPSWSVSHFIYSTSALLTRRSFLCNAGVVSLTLCPH